jgi:hypothetical protein
MRYKLLQIVNTQDACLHALGKGQEIGEAANPVQTKELSTIQRPAALLTA